MLLFRGPGILCGFRPTFYALPSANRYLATKAYDPLRILFCGSDEFSIASLKALHAEHLSRPDRIASIDVVCRPGKRVGRGLKKIQEGMFAHEKQFGILPADMLVDRNSPYQSSRNRLIASYP